MIRTLSLSSNSYLSRKGGKFLTSRSVLLKPLSQTYHPNSEMIMNKHRHPLTVTLALVTYYSSISLPTHSTWATSIYATKPTLKKSSTSPSTSAFVGDRASTLKSNPYSLYSQCRTLTNSFPCSSLLTKAPLKSFKSTGLQLSSDANVKSDNNESSTIENDNKNNEYLSSYATTYHAPVMARECIEAMLQSGGKRKKFNDNNSETDDAERSPLILVDGTLGGGGHSKALLEKMKPGDILVGCDVDPDALSTASKRLEKYLAPPISLESQNPPTHPIFLPVQSNFRYLHKVIPKLEHPYLPNEALLDNDHDSVDAILMDLGVSSYQIDEPTRGFAFLKEGPLDMRMNSNDGNVRAGTPTAADICNEFTEKEIIRILKRYGDEPRAKSIARSIVQRRPLYTTSDLVSAVAEVTPEFARKGRRMGRTATLARVFQALRIVVNEEDLALKEALEDMTSSLVTKEGGRLVILSYHSMEDGMVKRVMRDGTAEKKRGVRQDERDMYGNYIGKGKPWKMLGKGRKATEEEVDINSRARSATLRIAERLLQKED